MEEILFEKNLQTGVAHLILNRPEKRNALTEDMEEEIVRILKSLTFDKDVKVLIIKGRGKSFCSGHDMTVKPKHGDHMVDILAVKERIAVLRWEHMINNMINEFEVFWEMPQLTISQVHGYAHTRGCDLALFCDLVYAADDAVFRRDPLWDAGGRWTDLWPLHMGIRKAKETILMDEPISGKQAAELGLINRSVPADRLEAEVEAAAARIARLPLEFIAFNRLSINKFFQEMGIKNAVEAGVNWHVMATTLSQSETIRKVVHDQGWRTGLQGYRSKEMLSGEEKKG